MCLGDIPFVHCQQISHSAVSQIFRNKNRTSISWMILHGIVLSLNLMTVWLTFCMHACTYGYIWRSMLGCIQTALHWAAKFGKPEVVKMLANRIGVNVNQRSVSFCCRLAATVGLPQAGWVGVGFSLSTHCLGFGTDLCLCSCHGSSYLRLTVSKFKFFSEL